MNTVQYGSLTDLLANFAAGELRTSIMQSVAPSCYVLTRIFCFVCRQPKLKSCNVLHMCPCRYILAHLHVCAALCLSLCLPTAICLLPCAFCLLPSVPCPLPVHVHVLTVAWCSFQLFSCSASSHAWLPFVCAHIFQVLPQKLIYVTAAKRLLPTRRTTPHGLRTDFCPGHSMFVRRMMLICQLEKRI